MKIGSLLRESIASAKSQPVASTLTLLVIAGTIFAVLMTTGRAVGAEQRVLQSIDSIGTRTITVTAQEGAGVTSEAIERIASLDNIEWSGAFSSSFDTVNAAIPGGSKVAARFVYTLDLRTLGLRSSSDGEQIGFPSPEARSTLGLAEYAGAVASSDGTTAGVAGRYDPPDFLQSLSPVLLVPRDPSENEPVSRIFVVAASPGDVLSLAPAVSSVLGAADTSKVQVETSSDLLQLRNVIDGQLGSFSRGLVLALLGVTGLIVSVLLYGLVMMRRKDFGRRRALGATRLFVIALLTLQTFILAAAGVASGMTLGITALVLTSDPIPDVRFIAALALLAILSASGAAVIPGVVASRRQPIRELRIP